MTMARRHVLRCGYCGEEKAINYMALSNLCVRDNKQRPTGAAIASQIKTVMQCLDCREHKTAPAFAIPDLCQRCLIERLPPEPEELADEPATAAASNQDIASKVTDAILDLLSQGKLPPWKMGFEFGNARNGITGREYQGVNQLILMTELTRNGWTDSRWLTEKQTRQAGGRVKAGAKPTEIHFYMPNWDGGNDGSGIHIVKTHEVYNLDQTTIILPQPLILDRPDGFNPIAEAERIIKEMPQPPSIDQRGVMTGPAHYQPWNDLIVIPIPELFDTPEHYYEVMFHELAHSTGHKSRLNRHDQAPIRCTEDRGREELVAEMTAAMLCEKAGIGLQSIENAGAYIKSWADTIRAEPGIIVQASHLAERAFNFIAPEN